MKRRPRIVSAAGCAGLYPPNTLAGVQAALYHGADIVEVDVAITSDSKLIARHNLRLNPGFDRDARGDWVKPPYAAIRDLTYAELQSIDVGRPRPGSHYERIFPEMSPLDGARIPLVEEVIATIAAAPAPPILELELKSQAPELSPPPEVFAGAIAALYEEHKQRLPLAASSFDWTLLAHLRSLARDLPIYLLAPEGLHERDCGGGALIERAKALNAATVGVYAFEADAALVARAHDAGLEIMIWGLIDPFDPGEYLKAGVDAIVTVRPDLFRWGRP
ncbi:MAG: glycerophosphodiester phosphodiesterase family protein [Parvularculaceae bacterium]